MMICDNGLLFWATQYIAQKRLTNNN